MIVGEQTRLRVVKSDGDGEESGKPGEGPAADERLTGGLDPHKRARLQREFERNYRESYDRVYNYVFYRCLNRAVAEDVVAEAFLKAAGAFERFDPERAAFSTWMFTIAHNCFVSYMRKASHEYSTDEFPVHLLPVHEDEYEGLDESGAMCTRLLKELSDIDRELVFLKFYEEMGNREIGARLGMNASTVGTRLSRAMAKMRKSAQKLGLEWETDER